MDDFGGLLKGLGDFKKTEAQVSIFTAIASSITAPMTANAELIKTQVDEKKLELATQKFNQISKQAERLRHNDKSLTYDAAFNIAKKRWDKLNEE